ncbi:MAG: hypothetical protein A2934_01585 [Candidatus Sungbacteria bacterium RIFCSPLOWO2_01_FULL_47_10]|uniref:Uncharacterized protein n=1 Tax=Candidatus Sungbacteria bacterium RIFCSPLOWO2_01_FULL_47_10 TaxID=1802276 RepID=A0A1G2L7N8_9BACT|nr:MAG: hypothetical protein A2934_01585 [Candidatus Sungbacteria bacterium RIFCSPLOWO2_01_FULL_47_10]
MKDWNHDLVHALSEKNDALWRYRNHYKGASKDCSSCSLLWTSLEQDDEKHVNMLADEIKRHIAENRFD